MRAILLGILGVTTIVNAGLVLAPKVLEPSDPNIPIPVPTRKLEWGDINVLHTTDIHGWISGHSKEVYPEKSWSGNFGDFYSFKENTDLLLVDTGDRRIGHGLTDEVFAADEGINGRKVSKMYLKLNYDLVIPGNHDLQNPEVVKWTKDVLVHKWGSKYLTSNINRTDEVNKEKRKPLGVRSRTWKTRKGRRIKAFGVTYSKTRLPENSGLEIIPIDQMVEQQWFKDDIKPNPAKLVDVFVLLGHVDPRPNRTDTGTRADDIQLIYQAIRNEHPLTPIMIFTGHTHKRWCERLRVNGFTRGMLLQSGRYFDTVGWMSVKLDDNKTPQDSVFRRRYLDNNIQTYVYHAGVDEANFHQRAGLRLTKKIHKVLKSENLTKTYGSLDSDYFLDRKKWEDLDENNRDKSSLFNFYLDAVEHTLIDRDLSPNWLFFSNWGVLRGDIYKGKFTKADLYAISPNDRTNFLYTTIPRYQADKIIETIRAKEIKERLSKDPKPENLTAPQPEPLVVTNGESQSRFSLLAENRDIFPITYGWEIDDECGSDENDETGRKSGNDVAHKQFDHVDFDNADNFPVYFWRRNYKPNTIDDNTPVDIIFTNYIGRGKVPAALDELGIVVKRNVTVYRTDVTQFDLLSKYIEAKFPHSHAGGRAD